jgi:molecular chaperone DnaK (HSP70)
MPYALDFGTSNTVITRWNSATQQAETVKLTPLSQQLGDNPPLIPSLLYVEDARTGKVILGQQVRDQGLDLKNDPRFWRAFKRGIGAQIQGFLPELDDQVVTFEQVGNWFLGGIISQLPNLDSLVLTVPVDSFEAYRHWLSRSCQAWQIEQIRLLDEPTAAALGYGVDDNSLILVVDFGGGTLDLSLVQIDLGNTQKNQGFILKWGEKILANSTAQKVKLARVLGKAGANLGGTDIDTWLLDYFAQSQGIPKSTLTLGLVERLKIKLSQTTQATEVYFNDQTLDSYELSLERTEFEQILRQQNFFTQLDELMMQVLQQGRRNGIEVSDIETVLVVGGSGQIPSVQDWVRQYFSGERIRGDRPFSAVALGALQLAQGFQVQDFLYHGYGVRYWNRRQNAHGWHPIIQAGQAYPLPTPVELTLGASVENQPSVELIIGEIGAESGATEVYFQGDRLMTRSLGIGETQVQPLNAGEGARTIAQLNPKGVPGRDRLKVKFFVDEQRLLRITVEDLLTQETLLSNQVVTELT